MPSLNWIGKDRIENHDKEVAFRLLKKNEKLSLGKSSENLIIQEENSRNMVPGVFHFPNFIKLAII